MILTHDSNSIGSGGSGGVNIGGRNYETIKIGSLEWTKQNIEYEYPGLQVNPDSTGWSGFCAWYYNNDKNTYGLDGTYKCGLLYNQNAAIEMNSYLEDGWRVATAADWQTLVGNLNALDIIAKNNEIAPGFPTGWGANNITLLTLLPTGRRQDRSFNRFNGDAINYWATDKSGSLGKYLNIVFIGRIYDFSVGEKTSVNEGHPIRIVRDIT